jgi:tetratricopeptide (TPR) repeat protein
MLSSKCHINLDLITQKEVKYSFNCRFKSTKSKNLKRTLVSPDQSKESSKSKSLAKKLRSSVNKKTGKNKVRSKLTTLKSSSSNVNKEDKINFKASIRKTNTSSPSRLMSNLSSKKHTSGRHLGKHSGDNQVKKKKSESNSKSKKVLRDGIKNLHNSQNLKKNSSQKKYNSREYEKVSNTGISRFNNYLNNKSCMHMNNEAKMSKGASPIDEMMLQSKSHLLSQTLKPLFKPFLYALMERHRDALDCFFGLPSTYCNDPWVLANIAKCYTELTNHKVADLYFARAFKPLPNPFPCYEDSDIPGLTKNDEKFLSKSTPDRLFSRIENIEFYSSCLWHLKKQQELCLLAHHCLENHFFSSETWIVLANTYSLNQDHETALQFLSRALKIDPDNAYAYCLSGHEHACKENFDQAGHCYRNAINIDPRNVRAYWGLGNLSLKMEKFDTAIDYFMKALKINDKCSTFYTQIGIAFLNKNNLELALSYMKRGEDINPDDPFNRYNKAYVNIFEIILLIKGFI